MLLVTLYGFMSFFPSQVYAQAPTPWDLGRCFFRDITLPSGEVIRDVNVATLEGLECLFRNIISVALTLAGLALFVMLIVGGFQYLTSGGEVEAATKARKTLTYAFFGLVLVVAAFLILRFIEVFTGVTLTEFKITQ